MKKRKSLNSFHTMILNIDNNNNNLGINDNFIPKTSSNFLFDTNTFSYQLSNDNNNDKKLNEILKQKSLLKIKEYNEQLKLREKDKKKSLTRSSGTNTDFYRSNSDSLNSSSSYDST